MSIKPLSVADRPSVRTILLITKSSEAVIYLTRANACIRQRHRRKYIVKATSKCMMPAGDLTRTTYRALLRSCNLFEQAALVSLHCKVPNCMQAAMNALKLLYTQGSKSEGLRLRLPVQLQSTPPFRLLKDAQGEQH